MCSAPRCESPAPSQDPSQAHGSNARKASARRADDGPEPELDSGYAWLILLIMFLLQANVSGSTRVYGLVYAREVAANYYDREQASWPIATASAVENLAGIVSPLLVRRLSWRAIELLSTVLFVAANLLAYFSNSLAIDVVALGLVQGLALSTSTVLSLVINNDYFERYRTTAFGIALSGTSFGVLYLTPLVSHLLAAHEDFRLVYLALAGVFSLNAPLVLFLRPRRRRNPPAARHNGQHVASGQCSSDRGSLDLELGAPATDKAPRKLSKFEAHFERRLSIASISLSARLWRQAELSRMAAHEGESMDSQAPINATAFERRARPGTLNKSRSCVELAIGGLGYKVLPKKMSVSSALHQDSARLADSDWLVDEDAIYSTLQDATQTGVVKCAAEQAPVAPTKKISFVNQSTLGAHTQSQHSITPSPSLGGSAAEKLERLDEFSFAELILLLRSPYLHCAWLMLTLYYLISRVLVLILPDFAVDHGLGTSQAAGLLNFWSLGELVGRLLLGALIDLNFFSCRSCIALACLSTALLLSLMTMAESYALYALCSALVAAFVSLEYMLINVLMVEYLGRNSVTNCYVMAAFVSAPILFARPALIGLFRDRLGSYDGLLQTLAGLAFAYAVLFYLLEPFLVRRWPKCSLAAAGVATVAR